ncbi:hypothetical protein KKB71_01960 [Patescibacteria group bacterium]|nr:hypothetical protein [Patescibacteria group bacterium]MBU2219381.1 hypothetical protein [Patescibacteria group bacterium]
MKFETFNPPGTEQKPIQETGLRKKIERIARNAVVWGMVSIAGIMAARGFKEEFDYKNYKESAKIADKIKYEEIKKELIKKIGEKNIRIIETGDKEAFFNRKEGAEKPIIKNFERVDLNSSVLEKIWKDGDTYPKGWIDGEVESIEYTEKKFSMKDYGPEFKERNADAVMERYLERILVNIDKEEMKRFEKRDLIDGLNFRVSHELGHSNDWETDNELSLVERVQLLKEIISRMESEKPFISIMSEFIGEKSYHQKIRKANIEEENILRAKEYWAEICEYYFNMPDWLQEKYPEDFAIVDKYVKKNDHNFNPFVAKDKRNSILQNKYGLSEAEKTFGLNK